MRRLLILAAAISALTACAPVAPPRVVSTNPGPDLQPVRPAASFVETISMIDPAVRSRMSHSWRPGCPVGIEDLRLLHLRFWGFEDAAHTGELVVHVSVASDVVMVFRRLYEARFPIRRMRLVDVYGGDDGRSMAADNTSGFNCRYSVGSPGEWSEHSFGKAIDINPVENPYVASSGAVEPRAGRAFLNRRPATGVVRPGDVVVRAFRSIGWSWGGDYERSKDYQHFSLNGR